MPIKIFRQKGNKQIFYVFFGMIVGGSLSLMILLNVNFDNGSGFENKNLWEWLDLFLLPLILLIGLLVVYWYNNNTNELRSHLHRGIALDNQREALMNSYLELITGLFLEGESDLDHEEDRGSSEDIVKAHTLTLFRRLDGVRKGIVLRFLFDAELLFQDENVFDVRGADLREVQLDGADLRSINLSGTDMQGANLYGVKLSGASLSDADLRKVNLLNAELIESDLRRVRLSEAELCGAILTRADLNMAEIDNSDLSQALLEGADLRGTKLCGSSLRGAYLMDTMMQRAILRGANLSGAYLNRADLSESDLTDANLTDAVLNRAMLVGSNITEQQLASVRSFEDAVIPNKD